MGPGGDLPGILLLAPHFPPEPLAGAARLGSLARELRALGHPVEVIAPRLQRGRGRLANLRHQLAMRRALREGGMQALRRGFAPRVVLVSSPPPLAALAGIDVARAAGAALVLDVRDLWPDVLIEAGEMARCSPAAAILRLVERRLLGAAALVTTPTRSKADRLRSRTASPVELVVNGVDEAWLAGAGEYGGGGDPLEVLYAGNIGRVQDVALLARAVEGLPDARATIVGDGERHGEVEGLASARVALLPPETREQIRQRLAGCGCAFVSLRTAAMIDAVPSKLLEAMALGVPVIAAVSGEAGEIVEVSGGGLRVDPGDLPGLRSAVGRMASWTAAQRREMGALGRRFVLERFRREDAARRLSQAIRAACG